MVRQGGCVPFVIGGAAIVGQIGVPDQLDQQAQIGVLAQLALGDRLLKNIADGQQQLLGRCLLYTSPSPRD